MASDDARSRCERLVQVNAPFSLVTPPAVVPGPARSVVACAATSCAVFFIQPDAPSTILASRLSPTGELLDTPRVVVAEAAASFSVVGVRDSYVVAAASKLLRLHASTLQVAADLSNVLGNEGVFALHTNGSSVLIVRPDPSAAPRTAVTVDATSWQVVGTQEILDWWNPSVIAGEGQYLFVYPSYGFARRLGDQTGTWLGPGISLWAGDGTTTAGGFYRDGTYFVAWNGWNDAGPDPNLYGVRVDATSGRVLESVGDDLNPAVLCRECTDFRVLGGVIIGGAPHYFLEQYGSQQFLLEIDPVSGERAHPALNGPDVTLPGPLLGTLAPLPAPRFAAVGGGSIRLLSSDPNSWVSEEPIYAGVTSGIRARDLRAAANGRQYLVDWRDADTRRAVRVDVSTGVGVVLDDPPLQIDGPSQALSSAGGKYLYVDTRKTDSGSIELRKRVWSDLGVPSEELVVPTTLRASAPQLVLPRLSTDGSKYLLMVLVGRPLNASVHAQLLAADGSELTALSKLDDGSLGTHRAVADGAGGFVVLTGGLEVSSLSRISANGEVSEPITLPRRASYLENIGSQIFILSNPPMVTDPTLRTFTDLPANSASGRPVWDGRSFLMIDTEQRPDTGLLLLLERMNPEFQPLAPGEQIELARHLNAGTAAYAAASAGAGESLVAYMKSAPPAYTLELEARLIKNDGVAPPVGGSGGTAGMGPSGGSGGVREPLTGGAAGSSSDGQSANGGADSSGEAGSPASVDPCAPGATDGSEIDGGSCALSPRERPRTPGALCIAALAALSLRARARRRQRGPAAV